MISKGCIKVIIQRYLLTLLSFGVLMSFDSRAQSLLFGKVIDRSQNPIPFANVYIVQNFFGVYTNIEGEFQFVLDSSYLNNDSLVISHIGYHSVYVPLQSIKYSQNQVFILEENVSFLAEVTISANKEKLNAKAIVEAAIAAIPNTIDTNAHVLNGYFRLVNLEGNEYKRLIEAAIKTYEPAYSIVENPKFNIEEIRRSIDARESEYIPWINDYFYGENSANVEDVKKEITKGKDQFKVYEASSSQLKHWESKNESSQFYFFYLFNKVRARHKTKERPAYLRHPPLNEDFVIMHKFKFDTFTVIDDKLSYVIKILPSGKSYKPAIDYFIPLGKIYIRVEDLAIMQLEYNYVLHPKVSNSKRNFALRVFGSEILFESVAKYREYNNKMYLAYLYRRTVDDVAYSFRNDKNEKKYFFVEQEYMVNDVITDHNELKQMISDCPWHENLYTFDKAYNEGFWNNFLTKKETQKEVELRVALEAEASLAEQFKKGN